MVSTVGAQRAAGPLRRPARIIELVGPAGAGKSTLRRALAARDNRIVPCDPPYYRKIGEIPFFAGNTVRLLPTILQLWRSSDHSGLGRRQIDWMVILQGWPRVLVQRTRSSDAIVVLDQGPVHLLVELSDYRPQCLPGQSGNRWWDNLYQQWARTLDLLVYLDAADPSLAGRIRTREKWHRVKDRPEDTVSEFLGRYRKVCAGVLDRLISQPGGPALLCIDTAQCSANQLADRLLETIGQENVGRE